MTVLNAVYAKCKILHGNISNRAILLQKTARGIKGILAEFDYACYAGADAVEVPELMLFQSIRRLEDPKAVRTFRDDLESLLYLVCWLGTFGVNKAQRTAYIAGLPKDPNLSILTWNQGSAAQIAQQKRDHLAGIEPFRNKILYNMPQGPLRRLAEVIYRALFIHPDCHGADKVTDEYVEEMEDGRIKAALLRIPSINGRRDPLVLYYAPATMNDIVSNFQPAVLGHKDAVLAALNAGGADEVPCAPPLPSAGPSMKHYRDEVPVAGPSKRPRY
ncbi:hypothetical protein LPJ71_008623 [Coemansia sp. S17]|nr:hypothetical protein LPJ71_008623 [Coemansia sp. S17]